MPAPPEVNACGTRQQKGVELPLNQSHQKALKCPRQPGTEIEKFAVWGAGFDVDEFIRRFMRRHVLPAGLQRIRNHGVLPNGCKKTQLARERGPTSAEPARAAPARAARRASTDPCRWRRA